MFLLTNNKGCCTKFVTPMCLRQSNASLTDKDKLLTTQIEKCLFKCSGNLLNKAYRRAGRKIVFELTYQQQRRQDSNSIPLNFDDIEALVTKHVKK